MSTAGSFPVFGSGGRLEGDLTKEQTPTRSIPHETKPQPTMEYRDCARDQAEGDAAFHAAAMLYQPELTRAQDARRLAQTAVQQWTHVCVEQQATVTRLQDLVQRGSLSLEHEDAEADTREQRLSRCRSQLRESHKQLEAAQAELSAAQQKIKSLVTL